MKYFTTLLIAFFSFSLVSLNAQFFVGGSVNFNSTSSNHDNGTSSPQKTKNYGIDFSPSAGKFLSEKLAAGIGLSVSFSGNKLSGTFDNETNSSDIGISPFLRFYAMKWNKISIFGQGNIGFALTKSTTEANGVTTNTTKGTRSFLNIYPGLAYDVNDKFSIETSLSILNFGYTYTTNKNGSTKDKSSNFVVGGALSNIKTIGTITIGGIYKF